MQGMASGPHNLEPAVEKGAEGGGVRYPEWKQMRCHVYWSVRDQTEVRMWVQVWNRVKDRAYDQVWSQVYDQVDVQVGRQVRGQMKAQTQVCPIPIQGPTPI